VQSEALALGRRIGPVGLELTDVDTNVFNPEWGIDVERVISPIRYPEADVIRQALDLYQTSFRKPSFTVSCLDYSHSMEGEGRQQLETAMNSLLDPELARQGLLQVAPDDITVVIPFDGAARPPVLVRGNDPADLAGLQQSIESTPLGDGTNIWDPVAAALRLLEQEGFEGRFPAVILMTDGEGNTGGMASVQQALADTGLEDVPVYDVLFGSASEEQVLEITDLTGGRVFDGQSDLTQAFRSARGYN
jgi:Ca-activated chloride channel family protein